VLEDSEQSEQDVKRVMFVEEQKITAAGYAIGTQSRPAAEETKDSTAAESAAADA